MKKTCYRCKDSGYYLGNGMIMTSCDKCNDEEILTDSLPSIDKINRKSESYKKAIKDIMNINPEITRQEAVKMFNDAYTKGG